MFFLNAKRCYKLLFLLLALPLSVLLRAQDAGQERLSVSAEFDYPPYSVVDENGAVTGFSVELLNAIAKEEGLNLGWKVGDWGETLEALESGETDLVPVMAITEERKAKVTFSDPYIHSFDAIFVRRSDKTITSQSDLLNSDVIVVSDDIAHEYLAGEQKHKRLIIVVSASEGMARLAAGEGSAMLMSRLPGLETIRNLSLDGIEALDTPVDWYSRSFGFGVSKQQTALLEVLNRGLKQVRDNGHYDTLFETWIRSTDQTAISHAKTQRSLDFTIAAFAFFAVLAILFIVILKSIISFKTAQLLQETEQRRHVEAIADQSESLFRGAFESSMQGSALLGSDGSWVRVNQALCELLGFSSEELISTNIKDFLTENDYEKYLTSSEKLDSEGQESCALEFRCLCRGREWKWVRVFLYLIQRENQDHNIYAQIQDISAKKDDEERLNRLLYDLEFTRTSLNRHAILSRTDAKGIINCVNDKFCSVSQYSSEELIGHNHRTVNSGFHSEAFFKDLWRTISSGNVWQGDVCNRRKDGSLYWVATTIVPHIGADNKPDSYLSIRTEITEIKEAESRLKEQREFLNTTLENIKDGIIVLNEQGEITFENPAAANCLSDIRNTADSSLNNSKARIPKEIQTAINNAMRGKASSGVPMTLPAQKNGEMHDFLMSCYPLAKSCGTRAGLLVSMHDITDQLNAEKQLSHSNLRFDSFFDNAITAIDLFDRDSNILKVNKAFENMLGYTEDEIKELGPLGITHPDDIEVSDSKLQAFTSGVIGSYQIEKRYIHKDGSTVWGRLSAFSVGAEEEEAYMVGMITDITPEKDMADEQSRLQRRLQQVEKMEAIGALTGGIAHDFNNILASIMGYTDLAMMKFCQDKEGKLNQYLTEVYKAGVRARDLVGQMMDFSRAGGGSRSDLAMGPIVKETLKMVGPTLPSSIQVNYDGDTDVPFISMDPVRLNQIVMNLVINARDALDEKGAISVSVKTYNGLTAECLACHKVIDGNYVELTVADNGVGISKSELKRIFDPFYTTKDVGKGTGMGLSVVHGIVHEYDGHILVESEEGKGSTFRVLFKAVTRLQNEFDGVELLSEEAEGLCKRVMVVDDEQMITDYLRELLESEGHQVSAYNSSEKALADFKKSPEKYDVVITDQTMPGILGVELTAEMKEIKADLPVILCTGYSELNIEALISGFDDISVMKKPIDRQELMNLINTPDLGA
ncbi:MAG: PAS domain S-box protein [Pseudomonadales bacterium]